MKKWKHFNIENRKVIAAGLSNKNKVCQIAKYLDCDPTSVSKEVKRNRTPIDNPYAKDSKCPKLQRWPYVCSNCKLRYKVCGFDKFRYDSNKANKLAKEKLILSRKGLDLDENEFNNIDSLIKQGTNEKKSIYQIKMENKEQITKSITTLYRYVNNGVLSTKRYELPQAERYKKRKHQKKYDYSNNKIDRTGHTYLDYLAYIKQRPGINVCQLDFLGAIKSDSKNIISLILPNLHFTLLDIIKNPNSTKVVEFFDSIENRIGIENFKELIPVILTDRDPCFSDILGICCSKETGEERCKIFYCDSYVSNQKPNVENINKQIRKFYPKGKSVDKYSHEDVKQHNITLLNMPIRSLDGFNPKEAFIKVYDEQLFIKLLDLVNDERM